MSEESKIEDWNCTNCGELTVKWDIENKEYLCSSCSHIVRPPGKYYYWSGTIDVKTPVLMGVIKLK